MKIVPSSKNCSDLFEIRITPVIHLFTKSQDSCMKLKISTYFKRNSKYFQNNFENDRCFGNNRKHLVVSKMRAFWLKKQRSYKYCYKCSVNIFFMKLSGTTKLSSYHTLDLSKMKLIHHLTNSVRTNKNLKKYFQH